MRIAGKKREITVMITTVKISGAWPANFDHLVGGESTGVIFGRATISATALIQQALHSRPCALDA